MFLTDHKVSDTAKDYRRDGAQSDDVRQDLRQEVYRHSVVATGVFMSEERNATVTGLYLITEICKHRYAS